jgi:hypothetical protein
VKPLGVGRYTVQWCSGLSGAGYRQEERVTDRSAVPPPVDPLWPTHDEIVTLVSKLDFAAEFEAAGVPYSELDEDGQVVIRTPPPASR